jgi:hypothetical protein
MAYDPHQHRAFIGGIWLIGFGILFATRAWWPGIMFVIGITLLFEGWLRRQPWYGFQAGFWSILIGIWALTRFNMAVFFIGLGISMIVGALIKPSPFSKPKAILDDRFE